MRVTVKGDWPGKLVVRQGWSLAEARPWNEDLLEPTVRVVRGGTPFIREATRSLVAHLDVAGVISPPLPEPRRGPWIEVGYDRWLDLHLYQRDLGLPVDALPLEPDVRILQPETPDLDRLATIDRRAFPRIWRLGRLGLEEARKATPRSTVLELSHGSEVVGFAIAGVGSGVGYLQRVAVEPSHQGRGYGRALVRSSLVWARRHGARSMLLNTQPDNEPAAALYRSERFHRLPGDLHVLRFGTT